MKKNGFTIIEVVFVFLLIMGVTFLFLPRKLDSTRHARLISKWVQKYSEFEYMFSVIRAQQDSGSIGLFDGGKNNNDKERILLSTIKPYLRISSELKDKEYTQFFMDKSKILSSNLYYFNKFYITKSGEIIGLKWINLNCKSKQVCALINMDINGINPPNLWGYDIFGINVLKNSVEPFGKGVDPDYLRSDCQKRGFGVYCSYYYLIGGRFD